MPFSQSTQLSPIMGYVETTGARRVLDVGAGLGQYGLLCRIYLQSVDLFDHGADPAGAPYLRLRDKAEQELRIDGIEGCAAYRNPVHEMAYNTVWWGEALGLLRGMDDDSYDLALAVDILEHFEAEEGTAFLAELARVAPRASLVSTPRVFRHQEYEEAPYETHRSHWSRRDLERAGYRRFLDNPISWIAVRESL